MQNLFLRQRGCFPLDDVRELAYLKSHERRHPSTTQDSLYPLAGYESHTAAATYYRTAATGDAAGADGDGQLSDANSAALPDVWAIW